MQFFFFSLSSIEVTSYLAGMNLRRVITFNKPGRAGKRYFFVIPTILLIKPTFDRMAENDKEEIDEHQQFFIILKWYVYICCGAAENVLLHSMSESPHLALRNKMDILVQKDRGLYETLTVALFYGRHRFTSELERADEVKMKSKCVHAY